MWGRVFPLQELRAAQDFLPAPKMIGEPAQRSQERMEQHAARAVPAVVREVALENAPEALAPAGGKPEMESLEPAPNCKRL